MTTRQLESKIQQIVKKAEKKGFKIHKNNIARAKPINKVCGVIKSRYPLSTEELLCR